MARRTVLLNNISGGSGGGLTTNTIPKASGPETLADSSITDSGTAVVTTSTFQATNITATSSLVGADVTSTSWFRAFSAAKYLQVAHDGSNGTLSTNATGGGIVIAPVGANGWAFNTANVLGPNDDNASALGQAAARISAVHVGSFVAVGTNPAASGAIRTANGAVITTSGAGGLTIGASGASLKQFFADYTDISGGVTGNAAISKMAGSVNAAIAATTITVTNTLVTTSTKVFAIGATNDGTFRVTNVVPAPGSFVINFVAPAAETRINWFIVNTD